ncbi:MAG: efflux RND transporter periplasmic adaptor subunit, partial [Butyricicoccus sp.]
MEDKMTTLGQEGQQEAVQGIAEAMDGAPEPEELNAPVRNRYADLMNGPKRRVPRPVKIGLTVLVLAGLIVGGVYLVRKTGEDPVQQAGENTAFAARGYLETYIEGDGQIAARTQLELGKELKGKVTEVFVQAGQAVKAGDKLFTVDPAEFRTELDTARKEMDEAQRSLDEAAAGVTAAEEDVTELTTTAAFDGRMLPVEDEDAKTWRVGDELAAGTVLGTLADDTVMKLPLYFSYAYINDIKKGAAATVSIPANMSTVAGTVELVEAVEKVSDDGTRLFRVTIAIQNPGALKKGMAASAEVSTA